MTEQQLTSGERIVLQELVTIGEKISATNLSQRLKEKEERVISILNALTERGVVELHINELVD